jgi:hypothetical protein
VYDARKLGAKLCVMPRAHVAYDDRRIIGVAAEQIT